MTTIPPKEILQLISRELGHSEVDLIAPSQHKGKGTKTGKQTKDHYMPFPLPLHPPCTMKSDSENGGSSNNYCPPPTGQEDCGSWT